MKYFVKFFVITFCIIVSTHAFAEQKIVMVDMTYVLNQSKAGQGAQDFLKKKFESSQKKFADKEKDLKKEESDLLGKKNIITKEEYKKSTDNLRKKVLEYQSERRKVLDEIAKQRATARKQLLDKINPIIADYLKENNISIVIDKKIVFIAESSVDITNTVIDKLNSELPSLSLK